MLIPIDEVVFFDVCTRNASTGAVSDADSAPTFDVFEESTDTPILDDQAMTKRTSLTGNYRGSFTASAANGFEAGKWYSVIVSATVSSVSDKAVAMHFRVAPAEASAGVPKADTSHWNGTSVGSTITIGGLTITNTFTISDGMVVNRSTGNSHAVVFTGSGVGAGCRFIGGSGGRGLDIVGGTDTQGLRVTSGGTGSAVYLNPGSSGHGFEILTSNGGGNAMQIVSGAGHAVNIAAGGNNVHGIRVVGGTGGTSDGINVTAGTGGVGLRVDTVTLTTFTVTTNAVAWNAAWDAEVQSEADDALAAFFTSSAALVDAVWDEARSGHATAGTFGEYVNANVTLISGDAVAADNLEAALDGTGGVTITAGITGNITGNLSGSAGSVSGAVGSVSGNVGGNVVGTIGGLTAAALKDFFDTDSTTTYAASVAGSVVKEIVDNVSGGGGGATPSAIADAVWDEARSGHTTAGTFGEYVNANVTHYGGSAGTFASGKPQVNLAATGLDQLSTAGPSGPATTFREMVVQLWRRQFKKAVLTKTGSGVGTLVTYADDGTTPVTTQAYTETSTVQTLGAAT